jgi:hypothetical protein
MDLASGSACWLVSWATRHTAAAGLRLSGKRRARPGHVPAPNPYPCQGPPRPGTLPRPGPRGVNGMDNIRASDRPKGLIIRLDSLFRISVVFSDFGSGYGYFCSDNGYGYGRTDIRRISDIRKFFRIYPTSYSEIIRPISQLP